MAFVKADTAQYSCKIAGQVFQVLNVDIREEVSGLFRIGLNLWLDNPELAIAPLLRKAVEITITWETKEKKYFGIVANMRQTEAGRVGEVDASQEYGHYAVEVVPDLWQLSRKTNCRIFQNLSADKIITKVLGERCPTQQYETKLTRSYEPREYCVQYRETDLAFISRLMEEEGIFYYFTHDGPEKMIIGDSPSAYGTCAPETKAIYVKATGLAGKDEYFSQLTYEENVYSGKIVFKDFDYNKPKNALKVEATGPGQDDLEIYDYHPKRYTSDGHGRALATSAEEAQSAMRTVLEASGNWRSVAAGCKFTLEKAYRSDLNREWVIISASHSASQVSGIDYQISILAIPADTVFRPVPRAPQPEMDPQTATVVGPSGQEIYMDDQGRAKVQFHWDLEGQKDENTTCWIRVAQHYAGMKEETSKRHGFHWHPLIGDEVIVDYLEGDPDNPIVTGSVYNGVNTPLIKPDEHIRNMMLTRYQHRLLFDDKNTTITLNTGGGESLDMVDKKEKEGKITLTTTGDEKLTFEDVSDEYGNMLRLETKDGHKLIMAEKDPKRGIQYSSKEGHILELNDQLKRMGLQTKEGHKFDLTDKDKRVGLYTKDGHAVIFDDKKQEILMQSKGGHNIRVSDKSKFIEISDSSGKHHIKIDISGGKITVESKTGSIDIKAPTGTLSLDAQNIKLKSKTDIKMDCVNLKVKAKATIKEEANAGYELKALKVKQEATTTFNQKGLTVTSEAKTMHKVKGLMVNSEASGVNILKGSLVKIN
ncbi:MAG: type VI secretion system tip protein VgrG [Acidobacteria bacterium]|nr:type VI secretion system tip protein VgrG [Acidobacteriota bacterium]